MPPLREPLPARVVTVICAGAVGALGAAVFLRLFVDLWLPATDADPRLHSEPVIVLLALPVGLFAGTLFRGVASAVSYWVGAFVGVLAMAYSSGWSGFAALAALLFLAIIPQALIAGFLVARGIDRPMSGSSRTGMARIARIFVVPSVVSLVLVGLVAVVDAAAVRASRTASCPSLVPGLAFSGRLAFVGSNAICVAELKDQSVSVVYASPTDTDEKLRSIHWSSDGSTLAVVPERRALHATATTDIALVTLDGQPPSVIEVPADVGTVQSLDWAPEGRRLVVAADPPGWSGAGRLLTVEIATSRFTEIPSPRGDADLSHPTWAPTGDRILVNAAKNETEALYGHGRLLIIDLSGTVRAQVAQDVDFLSPAAWSLNESAIALGRNPGRGVDVVLGTPEGGPLVQLTPQMESGGYVSSTVHPVWAPDGKTLAAGFSMSDGKPATIVIIPAAGGPGRTLLTGPTDFDWAP